MRGDRRAGLIKRQFTSHHSSHSLMGSMSPHHTPAAGLLTRLLAGCRDAGRSQSWHRDIRKHVGWSALSLVGAGSIVRVQRKLLGAVPRATYESSGNQLKHRSNTQPGHLPHAFFPSSPCLPTTVPFLRSSPALVAAHWWSVRLGPVTYHSTGVCRGFSRASESGELASEQGSGVLPDPRGETCP